MSLPDGAKSLVNARDLAQVQVKEKGRSLRRAPLFDALLCVSDGT
jgi:hypothetical protein